MKMLSYNIRGLENSAKCKEVRDLIMKYKIDFACIKKMKKEDLDIFIARAIWGISNLGLQRTNWNIRRYCLNLERRFIKKCELLECSGCGRSHRPTSLMSTRPALSWKDNRHGMFC